MVHKYSKFYNDIITNAITLGKPVSGFFELTSRCNLQCKMCYICGSEDHQSLVKRELTAEQWIELGTQARDAGVLFLTLTGGEMFIRKDFWQIYEAFTQMGFIITLFTNASLITDETVQRLAELPPLSVSITIYGANPTTYKKITGHPEAYEKTVTSIRKLINAGINVQLKTTVIKYNSGEFDQLAKLARSMGQNISLVNYISPRREGSGTDPLANRLEPLELAHYEMNANSCMKLLYEQHGENKPIDIIDDDVMLDDTMKNNPDILVSEETAFRCTAGKCAFWLSWEGNMFPCGLLCDIQSDALTNGFEGSWKEIQKMCQQVPSCQECLSCSNYSTCMACPARLKLETGSYSKSAPYLCEYTNARIAVRELQQ